MSAINDRLTPFDAELCVMVESLTQKPCKPIRAAVNSYAIVVDYSVRPEPDFVAALIAAIEGRAGERFQSVEDFPDEKQLKIRIKYSEEKLPFCYGDETSKGEPDLSVADTYCRGEEVLRAVQVRRTDLERLQKFVGGGELRIPKCPGCKATFHFLNGSVFLDVDEYDYICSGKVAFFVIKRQEFEASFQLSDSDKVLGIK